MQSQPGSSLAVPHWGDNLQLCNQTAEYDCSALLKSLWTAASCSRWLLQSLTSGGIPPVSVCLHILFFSCLSSFKLSAMRIFILRARTQSTSRSFCLCYISSDPCCNWDWVLNFRVMCLAGGHIKSTDLLSGVHPARPFCTHT